jgi:hypothetical protein
MIFTASSFPEVPYRLLRFGSRLTGSQQAHHT